MTLNEMRDYLDRLKQQTPVIERDQSAPSVSVDEYAEMLRSKEQRTAGEETYLTWYDNGKVN